MNEIENRHWNGLLYDGFEVEVNVIPCGEDDLIFKDYEVIKDFLKGRCQKGIFRDVSAHGQTLE